MRSFFANIISLLSAHRSHWSTYYSTSCINQSKKAPVQEPDYAADAMKVDYRRILCPRKLQRSLRHRQWITRYFIRRHLRIVIWHFGISVDGSCWRGPCEFMRGSQRSEGGLRFRETTWPISSRSKEFRTSRGLTVIAVRTIWLSNARTIGKWFERAKRANNVEAGLVRRALSLERPIFRKTRQIGSTQVPAGISVSR